MIPKTEFFEWIEDYCLAQLSKIEKQQFETELKHNSELREELKLQKEIQSAITEKDVTSLREKLNEITQNSKGKVKDNGSFDLLDDFADIQEITETVSPEDLINYYDSLPKVHVYQHELASNENIHQFYKEQNQGRHNGKEDSMNGFDFEEMEELEDLEGLEEAIMEKDILNLRETLSQVAKSVKPQFSTEEIDNYLSGELKGSELKKFEAELAQNRALKEEVELHREMEGAISEMDVNNLRSRLSHIMDTETSWNVSEQSIEQYIDGELEGELLNEFIEELNENTDLMAEVTLRTNVNVALGESDIFSLRDELKSARKLSENTEIKSIVPDTSINLLNNWRRVVAVAVILLGIAGIYNVSINSLDNIANSFYTSPTGSSERSVTSTESVTSDELNYLNKGNFYLSNGDYTNAIEQYDLALSNDVQNSFVFHFYKGASFQNMNKFEDAILEYNQVIKQGDNYFLEEAEWNKSLCYMKLGDKEKTRQNLEAIINKNGYYKKEAKVVLRHLKFSIK
jgi:tetratricopeptide (TPR) repeat protein